MRALLFGACAIVIGTTVLAPSPASAGFVTETHHVVTGPGQLSAVDSMLSFEDQLQFAGFDSSLGQLLGVTFRVTSFAEVAGLLTNPSDVDTTYSYSMLTDADVSPPTLVKIGIKKAQLGGKGVLDPGGSLDVNLSVGDEYQFGVGTFSLTTYQSPFVVDFFHRGFRWDGADFSLESSSFAHAFELRSHRHAWRLVPQTTPRLQRVPIVDHRR